MKDLKAECVFNAEPPGLTADGYLIPCCRVDRRREEFEERGFFDESLHIQNVNDIESDVFNSDVWIAFFQEAQYSKETMPRICHHHCGINNVKRETLRLIETS